MEPYADEKYICEIKNLTLEYYIILQASVMANFINRVIWVWPDWDQTNHQGDYVMSSVGLGLVNIKPINIKGKSKPHYRGKAFCMCANNDTGVDCRTMIDPISGEFNDDQSPDFEGYPVRSEFCVIKKQLVVEEVHESRAVQFFAMPSWASSNESIVLDIDEDFYGCTYAVEDILNSNITMQRITRLNNLVAGFFCPFNSSQEKESDRFLVDLVATVRTLRACSIDTHISGTSKCQDILKMNIVDHYSNLLNLLLLTKSVIPCQKVDINIIQLVKDLVAFFSKMRIKQLKAVQATGFCATTSPRTLDADRRMFVVCMGANTPDESAVLVHRPSDKEIVRRTIVLRNILEKVMKKKPRLVTVARSVRDGYTPRESFERIEQDIFTALNTTSKGRVRFHYDKELLGGKPGWPARHKA